MKQNISLKGNNEELIIYCTDYIKTDKDLTITVPKNYKVIALMNEKVAFRIEPCIEKNIVKSYGKDLIGVQIKYAFILSKALPQISWGFGNIQVNNERLKEAYRMGANGKYIVEVDDLARLLNEFSNANEVTIDSLREKTVSIVKMIGTPILSSYFADTNVSVFEISSKLSDFREKMFNALVKEKMFIDMGLKIKDLTVESLHVNDDDLELIRNRING